MFSKTAPKIGLMDKPMGIKDHPKPTPYGGGIAVFSNTGLGMSKEDKVSGEGAGDYMDLQFFVEYGQNNSEYLGEIWGKAINRYINRFPVDWNNPAGSDSAYDAKTVQQWILLGDPSLKVGGYI